MVGLPLALEVELHVVQGIADLLEGGLGVETLITGSEQLADVAQTPPLALLRFLGSAEALANHLYQIVQLLEGLVLLDERLDLVIVQPESLACIEQV